MSTSTQAPFSRHTAQDHSGYAAPGKEMCAVMRGTYAGFWIPRQGTWLWVIKVWDGIEIVGTAADDFIVAVFYSPLPTLVHCSTCSGRLVVVEVD